MRLTLPRRMIVLLGWLLATSTAAEPVRIDGSSTVYPITAAIVDGLRREQPSLRIELAFSGSTGGLRKLIAGEIDIANASRPIKAKELEAIAADGRHIIEIPIAYDGLTVVVNRSNRFVDSMTVEELRTMWSPSSTVRTWRDVRPSWPDLPLRFFSPGRDSGTFDFFTEVVVGRPREMRQGSDMVMSEDDHVLVQGLTQAPGGIAYFGLAYYMENQAAMRAVPIGPSGAAVSPALETVRSGHYVPLSRPLFIYIDRARLDRPEVAQMAEYLVARAPRAAQAVGYVPLTDAGQALAEQRLQRRMIGSVFVGTESADVAAILAANQAATPESQPAATTPASVAPTVVAVESPRYPKSSPAVYAGQVDQLRDALIGLARLSLEDGATLGDLQIAFDLVGGRLQVLRQGADDSSTLGGR